MVSLLAKRGNLIKVNPMLHAGLTGGISSGKSTVSEMFRQIGAHIIDFDKIAHQVQEKGRPAWKDIVQAFGEEVLQENGAIDRQKLGDIVFRDDMKRSILNGIVHPAIFREWEKQVEKIKIERNDAIIMSDVPLLFEVGMNALFNVTILIYISAIVQANRLMVRNGFTREEARIRLCSQMPIEEKRKLADIIIDNSGTIEETQGVISRVWKDLLKREMESRQNTGGQHD
ncbi:MAG: dephospho-CoA kinase [Syntrophales bacterium]